MPEPKGGDGDDSLFVRVEGYREILQDFEAIKQTLRNMKEATEVLRQLEDIKEKSIGTFMDNLNRLNQRLSSVNNELPRVDREGGNQRKEVSRKPQNRDTEELVDESINDLHSELKGLKSELEKIE
ncbi:MAG: hypothetical protein SVV03_06465 [Candidatus Nanohaloarchaea archaeon]|nr:hypothetical protein [Candidatus Nanohaloarchaea archaeon]